MKADDPNDGYPPRPQGCGLPILIFILVVVALAGLICWTVS